MDVPQMIPITLGKVKKSEYKNGICTCQSNNGSISVLSYSPRTFQIRYNLFAECIDYQSYALNPDYSHQTNLKVKKEKNYVEVTNSQLSLKIKKNNSAFAVFDKKGKELVASADSKLNFHSINQTLFFHLKPKQGDKIIGLGEKTGPINRYGQVFTHNNTDHFAYTQTTDPIYSSIPFFICIRKNSCYGIFLDNPETSTFDFCTSNKRSYSISSETKQLNLFILTGDTVREIIEEYTNLTGKTPLPPLWSLGFHQSRYSYYPQSNLEELVLGMKNRDVPLDVIHLDIHYMDAYKAFTVDKKRFQNFKKTIQTLKKKGIRVVTIVDPGIKIEKGYKPYDEGMEKDYFVKYFDGKIFEGGVWPGRCYFPDFTKTKVQQWWSKLCHFYWKNGVSGIWNDMNEPAVWGQYFPPYTVFDFDGNPSVHYSGRNIYGSLMNKATKESYDNFFDKKKRPFVLTRACFAGVQKYAVKWTGDNIASDNHLLVGARLINCLGVSGVSYAGVDIGGFVDNTKPSLFARWMMLGTFTPFFRSHKMIDSRSSEPWDYGETIFSIVKNFIELRYRLIPYLYSSFWTTKNSGLPINKMLPIDYSSDEKVFEAEYQNQFLFGENILVCPSNTKNNFDKVYLPKEKAWYHFFTDKFYKGKQEIILEKYQEYLPVFVKSGSLIMLQEPCQNLSYNLPKTLEIHSYLSKNKNSISKITYYEDDGETHDYKKGYYFECSFVFHEKTFELKVEIINNKLSPRVKTIDFFIHGTTTKNIIKFHSKKSKKSYNLSNMKYLMLNKIPNFDPFQDTANNDVHLDVKFAKIDFI